MGQVTLRDLSTNEDIVVPPEGYIFGRVGGDADIQIEDNSISRRQARVSLKGGMWLLETLAVPAGAKPPRPVQLQEGASFTVGQSEFEVVQIEAEEEEPAAPTVTPQKGKPGPPPAVPAGKKPNPPPSNAKTQASPQPPKKGAAPAAAGAAEEAPAAGGGGGIKALFVGVPKGIAYYLLNVPKLLVNPIGSVRKTIEELPAEPMGKTDIIGYSVPAIFISGALPGLATGIASLIGPGHIFLLGSFLPIGPAIGALIGAVVNGFVFLPVWDWVIKKAKGKADARSLSNFFLHFMTLLIILAVPTAAGTLVSPIPFLGVLLAPLLTVVGSLVFFYVIYQWLVKFEVVKVLLTVVKVFAVLALLGAGFGFIGGIRTIIAGGGRGSISTASVATTDGSGDTEVSDTPPTDPAEQIEWAKKRSAQLQAQAADAQKKAMAGGNDAKAKAADAKDQAEDAKDDPPAKPEPVKTTKKDPPPKAEPVKAADPEPVAAKDTPPAAKDEPTVTPSAGYSTFAKRRDAIEKLLEADPTVLQKNSELQKLYGDYTEDAYDLDKKWNKETSKKPERAKLNAHLRDAELYGKSGKTIDAIAAKLGIK